MTTKKKVPTILIYLLMLIMITFIISGSYFIYDFPTLFAIQLNIKMGLTSLGVSIIYSAYSLPNIIAPLLLGIVIEMLGPGLYSFYMNILIFYCTLITFAGIYFNNFILLVLASFISGICAESLYVASVVITEKWFIGRLLSIVMALREFTALLCAALQDYILPYSFIKTRNLFIPFFLMIFFMFVIVVLTTGIPIIEMFYDPKMEVTKKPIKVFDGEELSTLQPLVENSERSMNKNLSNSIKKENTKKYVFTFRDLR